MNHQIREIITKAVIGKGHLNSKNIYKLELENNIDHVLGCWIVGHVYEANIKNEKILVKGEFDINLVATQLMHEPDSNLWYALEDEPQSKVHVQKIEYNDQLAIITKENVDLKNSIELICSCPMQPICLEAKILDMNHVEITIEKTVHVDIVGETKISIEITDKKEIWDEIDESINTAFLEK